MNTVKADGQFQGYHIEVLSEMSSQEEKMCLYFMPLPRRCDIFFLAKPTDVFRCIPWVRCAGHNEITDYILSGGHGPGPWAADINFCCSTNSLIWTTQFISKSLKTKLCLFGGDTAVTHCVFGFNGVGLIGLSH